MIENSVDKNRQIFFGQPIIDAISLQEDVNYYGVVLHNTVDKCMKENDFKKSEKYFFEAKTTLKSGKITHNNMNWFDLYPQNDNNKSRKVSLLELFESLKTNVSGRPRIYVDNTIEMMNLSKNDTH